MPASRVQTGATHNSARNCENDKQADILIRLYLLVQTLMPPQARVGDASMVPADAHGCPACPHPAVGPAIQGSPNVLTNGLPSVRVGDAGIHAACCGPNKWNAKTGSGSVLINGRPAHRLGDMVKHCGGVGNTMIGSPNVIVGDLSAANARSLASGDNREKPEDVGFFIHDEDRQPLCGIEATIVGPYGEKYPATTDKEGRILLRDVCPGEYRLEFSENVFVFSIGTLRPLK